MTLLWLTRGLVLSTRRAQTATARDVATLPRTARHPGAAQSRVGLLTALMSSQKRAWQKKSGCRYARLLRFRKQAHRISNLKSAPDLRPASSHWEIWAKDAANMSASNEPFTATCPLSLGLRTTPALRHVGAFRTPSCLLFPFSLWFLAACSALLIGTVFGAPAVVSLGLPYGALRMLPYCAVPRRMDLDRGCYGHLSEPAYREG